MRVAIAPASRSLALEPAAITSAHARAAVTAARERQRARHGGAGAWLNAELDAHVLARRVRLDARTERLLGDARRSGELTARGEHGAVRLARTIADLEGRARVRASDLAAALALRGASPSRSARASARG